MTPTRSVGQADFFSKSSKSNASCGASIVHKLASRSITGNGLQIQIHQHVDFKVHLVWHVFDKHNKKSVRCIERIFSEINALDAFCKQLKMGLLKDCVIVYVIVSSSAWTTKLGHVLWNILRRNASGNMFFYVLRNAQNKFKNKVETILNVYAPCLYLTGLAPLYGIVIPILLIWCDIVTCFTVHDFKTGRLLLTYAVTLWVKMNVYFFF